MPGMTYFVCVALWWALIACVWFWLRRWDNDAAKRIQGEVKRAEREFREKEN